MNKAVKKMCCSLICFLIITKLKDGLYDIELENNEVGEQYYTEQSGVVFA